ncbi:MAG: hypothetical protein H7A53_02740 [Akkermansiaceae bacterium]|nr:hypothetical protein [Akkermansiaceae bacterium]MCP5549801.1 hypothetical protein [Akkermansiaceae bacterium]
MKSVAKGRHCKRLFGYLAVVAGFWVLPVLIFSVGSKPPYWSVRFFSRQVSVVNLFTHRVSAWSYFQIQGRYTGGQGKWVDLRLSDFSRMENFGYLTRLDRMLDEAGDRRRGPVVRRELAAFLARETAARFPSGPALREVRYLRVSAPTGEPRIAFPAGPWANAPVENVPETWVRQIGVVTDRDWAPPPKPLANP